MNILFFIGFCIFVLFIYNWMWEGIFNNKIWRVLLLVYLIIEDVKLLFVVLFNLVYNYFDGIYFKWIFKFYRIVDGFLIIFSV